MGDTTFSRRAVADVDFALKQLGTDYLDIIVLCRVPSDTPIEEIVESMKAIVESGTLCEEQAQVPSIPVF